MWRSGARIAGACGVAVAIAGCGGSSGGSSDPASLLAQRDGSTDTSAYSAALDVWQAKCTEGRVTDAGYVDFAYDDLRTNGVGESSRLVVMRHLAASVPDSAAPTNCQSVTSGYLTLREQ